MQPGRARVVSKVSLASAAVVIRWQTLTGATPSHSGAQSRAWATRLGRQGSPVEHKLHPAQKGRKQNQACSVPSLGPSGLGEDRWNSFLAALGWGASVNSFC